MRALQIPLMLRIFALIYFVIEVVFTSLRLRSLLDINYEFEWFTALGLTINALGLIAVFAYYLNRSLLRSELWWVVLAAYIGMRVFELAQNGLVPTSAPLVTILVVSLRYAWLVLPPIAAMWYLAGKSASNENL